MNDLWIKSLLFDLNYKFIKIGASLLALAKSIYYIFMYKLDNNTYQRGWEKGRRWVKTESVFTR